MKKKLSIKNLEVKSFTTQLPHTEKLRGGTIDISCGASPCTSDCDDII